MGNVRVCMAYETFLYIASKMIQINLETVWTSRVCRFVTIFWEPLEVNKNLN